MPFAKRTLEYESILTTSTHLSNKAKNSSTDINEAIITAILPRYPKESSIFDSFSWNWTKDLWYSNRLLSCKDGVLSLIIDTDLTHNISIKAQKIGAVSIFFFIFIIIFEPIGSRADQISIWTFDKFFTSGWMKIS